ncbi:MAG: ATP-binding protein [Actinomycetota bacterium]|nr:hypothetical protein [Actinomycetota bacterium]
MSIWDRIVGQDRPRAFLQAAADDPADSYLLVGPPGSGKLDAAKVFAAAIVCPIRDDDCPNCSRILRDLHPDVSVFEPEGFTFPVETIRQMVATASLSPFESKRRAFVVEQADRIAERSQNALLKGLEEPNASVTWILVADALDPFLPTVLSRCQIVEFSAVTEQAIGALLKSRYNLPDAEVRAFIRYARGDLGKAQALASDSNVRALRDLAFDALTKIGSVEGALAAAERAAQIVASLSAGAEADQAAQLQELEASIGTGKGSASIKKKLTDKHKRALRKLESEAYIDLFDFFADGCRDAAAVAAGAPADVVINSDWGPSISKSTLGTHPSRWISLAELAANGKIAVMENANAPLVAEALFLSLTANQPVQSFSKVRSAGVAQG